MFPPSASSLCFPQSAKFESKDSFQSLNILSSFSLSYPSFTSSINIF